MSSLSAARADNYYNPPAWDPRRESRNQHQRRTGRGAARYKGHNQFSKAGVVRFEIPFNAWCLGCSAMIAKGVRFNAKKTPAGKYLSTPIFEFSMACHECSRPILVRTDPKNADFVFVRGARRKRESYSAAATGTVELLGPEERAAARADAMASLEVAETGRRRAAADKGTLQRLLERSNRLKDDYAASSKLRKDFRKRKRELKAEAVEQHRPGLQIRVQPATAQDLKAAALFHHDSDARCRASRAARRFQVSSSVLPCGTESVQWGRDAVEGALRRGLDPQSLRRIDPLAPPDAPPPASRPKICSAAGFSRIKQDRYAEQVRATASRGRASSKRHASRKKLLTARPVHKLASLAALSANYASDSD